jgi:hypothetical protein
VHPGVIADIDDGGQLVPGGEGVWGIWGFWGAWVSCVLSFRKLTEAEQLLDSQQEAGAADPTDQNGDLHIA